MISVLRDGMKSLTFKNYQIYLYFYIYISCLVEANSTKSRMFVSWLKSSSLLLSSSSLKRKLFPCLSIGWNLHTFLRLLCALKKQAPISAKLNELNATNALIGRHLFMNTNSFCLSVWPFTKLLDSNPKCSLLPLYRMFVLQLAAFVVVAVVEAKLHLLSNDTK